MDDYRKRLFREIATLSRNIFISWFVLFLGSFLLFISRIDWLQPIILAVSFIAVFISFIVPGMFVVLMKPWFAHAWLYGINPIGFSSKPWTELSPLGRIGIYFQALIMAIFACGLLIMIIKENLAK